MGSAALVAGPRSSTLSAASLVVARGGCVSRGSEPCGIALGTRPVVAELSFLVRDTGASNKAIGPIGASRHCLARIPRRSVQRHHSCRESKDHGKGKVTWHWDVVLRKYGEGTLPRVVA
jgi:hypothetical protein